MKSVDIKKFERTKGGYVYHHCSKCSHEDTIGKPIKTEEWQCPECNAIQAGYFVNYCDKCGVKFNGLRVDYIRSE